MIECALITAAAVAYIVAAGIGPESYEKHELASERAHLLAHWRGK